MTAARLLQQRLPDGTRRVILAEDAAHVLTGVATTRDLAQTAIAEGVSLLDAARARR